MPKCDHCGREGKLGGELFAFYVIKSRKHPDGCRLLCTRETGRDCVDRVYEKLREFFEERRTKEKEDIAAKVEMQKRSQEHIARIKSRLQSDNTK